MGEPDWPFIGSEALAAGQVSRRALRSHHEMVYRNVYVGKDQQVTPVSRAIAAWLWSGRTATVAGLSAAALHGSRWIDPGLPAELNRAEGCPIAGIVIHREALSADESCLVRGIPITTPARTAFDLGRRKGLTAAVIRLDALANVTELIPAAVRAVAERHPGARGLVQLRRVIELMDGGAESPQESRTRLLLVRSGLGSRRRRSWCMTVSAIRSPASTWAGRSGRSAWSSMARSTGLTRRSGRLISTVTPNWPPAAG